MNTIKKEKYKRKYDRLNFILIRQTKQILRKWTQRSAELSGRVVDLGSIWLLVGDSKEALYCVLAARL